MTLPAALERQVWQLTLMLFICRLLADKHFDWCRLRAQEVQRTAAGKDFDIAFVGWEQGD